jgi:hypothetical protein
MTSLFLVTSALYTSYGKCSTEERIEQTKETIKSIETYAPGLGSSKNVNSRMK